MRRYILFAASLFLAGPAHSNPAEAFAHGDPAHQQPLIPTDECITKTKTVTRTSYEVNVVSTVYRTRTRVDGADPTPDIRLEEAEQTLVFGVEGTSCDMKACTICRMLNDCSDEERDCIGCDLAYYCNQCSSTELVPSKRPEDIRIMKICSSGPERKNSCDEIEQEIAFRHEIFHAGE